MQCSVPFVKRSLLIVYSGGTTVYNGESTTVVLFIKYSNTRSYAFWGFSIRWDLEYSF